MKLTSPAFKDDSMIPDIYTCDGLDVSPPLEIEGVPGKAESLVVIVDDPDAPSGSWTHWLVWNISPATKRIEEGEIPIGAVLGMNDFGRLEYGGPAPPSGAHRYFFRLYALDKAVGLREGARKQDLLRSMSGHVLAEAVLMGKYRRFRAF
ncbi:MAG: YbhB/YbcL family Raf kinase inhibitor-like protein [Candidatus Aenigmarchaeota archaeon]|nr:YbhB/YbcL family Raf kinase inhibitor-like protein [Candidatus Aenigmarchaeota archaeon]